MELTLLRKLNAGNVDKTGIHICRILFEIKGRGRRNEIITTLITEPPISKVLFCPNKEHPVQKHEQAIRRSHF